MIEMNAIMRDYARVALFHATAFFGFSTRWNSTSYVLLAGLVVSVAGHWTC